MKTEELKDQLTGKTPVDQMKELVRLFPGEVLFTTSFGIEDQVISHMIFKEEIPAEVATLDTARLFPETYKVFGETIKKYKKPINVYSPDHEAVENMMTEKGPFSFYYSKDDRLECCRIRKLVPLNRALEGKKCWISGIRASQSDNRRQMDWMEFDEDRQYLSFTLSLTGPWRMLRSSSKKMMFHIMPCMTGGLSASGANPVHRAVEKGADFRSGRWWWEAGSLKECGLHIK